jgi:hypothetical protein
MKAIDLKVGSVVEIPLNLSPEKINVPTKVVIRRATEHYLWFAHNSLQRMGRNTFDDMVEHFGYKIISL